MKTISDQISQIKSLINFVPEKDLNKQHLSPRNEKIKKRTYKNCPYCNCVLRASNYVKHISTHKKIEDLQQEQSVSNTSQQPKNQEIVICSYCKVSLNKKNLSKHFRRAHPEFASESNLKTQPKEKKRKKRKSKRQFIARDKTPPLKKMTAEDAIYIRNALEESRNKTDKEIAQYLEKRPLIENLGKFGLPQDKYRWGFYGSGSMEYDSWSKIEKK